MKHNTPNKALLYLTYTVLTLGILLRLVVFLQNRNLFLDEAAVALNICTKSYAQLFHSLDYQQHFPPLPLLLIKTWTDLFGISDLQLRFIPFLAGVLSLLLFYSISKGRLRNMWFPILLLSSSIFLVRYHTELKQYSTDILTSLFFIYFLYLDFNNLRRIILLFLFCIVAPWFSMPSVFLVGALILNIVISKKIQWSQIMLLGIFSAISFLLFYTICLKPSLSSNHLMDFHTDYFIQLNPSDWGANWRMIENFFGAWLGSTAFTIASVLVLIVVGVYRMIKIGSKELWAISLVFLFTLVASLLQQYSMIPRLLLFWTPLILWIMAYGADQCIDSFRRLKIPSYLIAILFVGLFVFPNVFYRQAIDTFWSPFKIEQAKDLLQAIESDLSVEDEIWSTQFGSYFLKHYSECHQPPVRLSSNTKYFDHPNSAQSILDRLEQIDVNRNIWIFDAHTDYQLKERILSKYPEAELFEEKQCYVIRLSTFNSPLKPKSQ